MTIFALETPVKGPARCWLADDQEDYVTRTLALASERNSDWGTGEPTFDDAIAYNAQDLRQTHVYLTADEAVAALETGAVDGLDVLRDAVEKRSWEITNPVLAVKYGAEVDAILWATTRETSVMINALDGELIGMVSLPAPLADDEDAFGAVIDAIGVQGNWIVRNKGLPFRTNAGTPEASRGEHVIGMDVMIARD